MKGMFSKAEGGGMGEWTRWLQCFSESLLNLFSLWNQNEQNVFCTTFWKILFKLILYSGVAHLKG